MHFALLVVVMLAIGLLTSRVSLVVHELLGHGGAAWLLGGRVVEVEFFMFGGGWVKYARDARFSTAEALLISGGGIAIELLLGAILIFISFRVKAHLTRVLLFAFGGLDLIHAGFYLSAGIKEGYGDGAPFAHV